MSLSSSAAGVVRVLPTTALVAAAFSSGALGVAPRAMIRGPTCPLAPETATLRRGAAHEESTSPWRQLPTSERPRRCWTPLGPPARVERAATRTTCSPWPPSSPRAADVVPAWAKRLPRPRPNAPSTLPLARHLPTCAAHASPIRRDTQRVTSLALPTGRGAAVFARDAMTTHGSRQLSTTAPRRSSSEEPRHERSDGKAPTPPSSGKHPTAASPVRDPADSPLTPPASAAAGVPPKALSEDIWTLPNVLTMARLASTPLVAHLIVSERMSAACALLFLAGVTDVLDGWIARRRRSYTVFGSIADPAADKALMTATVLALAWRGLLPTPLAVLILGRDVALVVSAFVIRYRSLPAPKTLRRYFDPRLPSASVQPTQVSKYNTLLQLLLVGGTTLLPVLPVELERHAVATGVWTAFQCVVAMTTVWSGLSYVFGSGAVKYLGQQTRLGLAARGGAKPAATKSAPPPPPAADAAAPRAGASPSRTSGSAGGKT